MTRDQYGYNSELRYSRKALVDFKNVQAAWTVYHCKLKFAEHIIPQNVFFFHSLFFISTVHKGMSFLNLSEQVAINRAQWRDQWREKKIIAADPN